MRDKLLFWSALLACSLSFILFCANIAIINGNRDNQRVINERQTFINNMQNLSNLNQTLAQTLADISSKEKDTDLKDMLASQGIMVSDAAQTAANTESKAKK